jgi:hypothetical protein
MEVIDLIPDPTVVAVAAYDMTWQEIVFGWFLLSLVPGMYLVSKTLHPNDGPAVPTITRTPEKYFAGIEQPFKPNYFFVYDEIHRV